MLLHSMFMVCICICWYVERDTQHVLVILRILFHLLLFHFLLLSGFNAAAKAARILKVKQRADKQLDSLLAQVNKAIQRKKWRSKESQEGKGLA